jgi:hypothetical protein
MARLWLLRSGLVLGWLLLLLAIAQQAATSLEISGQPTPTLPRRQGPLAEMDPSSAALRDHADTSSSDDDILATLPETDLLTMEARIRERRDAGALDERESLAAADTLLANAVAIPKSEWRTRAGCYAAAGLLLKEYYPSTPSELERAGDALLVAAQMFVQNGSTVDAVAARDRAQGAYSAILHDQRVTDEVMLAAVKRKLARAGQIGAETAKSVR